MPGVVYIIPGFSESCSDAGYRRLQDMLQKYGITSIPVTITWKRRTMTQYMDEFLGQYKPGNKNSILGFSFGAMIALLTSRQTRPQKLMLCSLSPYFAEDLPHLKPQWRQMIGQHRYADLKKHSFSPAMREIKTPTFLFLGEKEAARYPSLNQRVHAAHRRLQKSQLIKIPRARHDIGQKEYLAAIETIVKNLRL